jgi:dTDP-4-amino-4,6-dideoxygalactose transaminase
VRVHGTVPRDELARRLAASGIETRAYYATPLHSEPCFLPLATPSLPHAEAASRELLALPMFYGLTEAQQRDVATALTLALR